MSLHQIGPRSLPPSSGWAFRLEPSSSLRAQYAAIETPYSAPHCMILTVLVCLRAILFSQQYNVGTVHTSFITLSIRRQGQRNKHSSQLHYHRTSRRTHLWRKPSVTMVGRSYVTHLGECDNWQKRRGGRGAAEGRIRFIPHTFQRNSVAGDCALFH